MERRRRFIQLCVIYIGALFNLMPRRVAFLALVACDLVRIPRRRRLETSYHPYVTSFLADHPDWCFSGRLSRLVPAHSARVLLGIGASREACQLISAEELARNSVELTMTFARALFELAEFRQARSAMSAGVLPQQPQKMAEVAFLKGMLDIIDGDEAAALESMRRACRKMPSLMRPHQNISSRPTWDYVPNYLDVVCGAPGRLFDLCNFTGQRVTHVGRGDIGVRLFTRALAAQSELQSLPPPSLSPELAQLLQDEGISFGELRIIPEEWSTQIGHLGMLDILFRMRELGWWSGKPLMVVRSGLVANHAFLRLFERFGKILIVDDTVSDFVGEELLSLQRWCGMNFNAFRMPNGHVVPWQEAGALAIAAWEEEGRSHPLRDEYDRIYGSSGEVAEKFQRIRESWGMKPDDWYVCLHARDASHYSELAGTGQSHRNSPIETYVDAIRFITGKGGWVIKLGGPNSQKLPPLARTIDYALSDLRSELMDLVLIRNASAFIGTTSGLTNVAISFGIPSAIVNCVTTDAQLWNKNVRFALKPVRLSNGNMLTPAQLTSAPWRWRVFDAAVLGRSGAHPDYNTSDEICAAVGEVHALIYGRSAEFELEYDAEALLSRWTEQLTLPHYYGTSRPSLYYLKKYETELLAEVNDATVLCDPDRSGLVNA